MKKYFFISFFSSLILLSCGTQRSVSEKGGGRNATANRVIKGNTETAPEFKTLYANLRGTYNDGNDKQSISVSMRMHKDKKIWLSANLAGLVPLAKMLITPDSVQFYDKIHQRYFAGDFRWLSKKLGVQMNFKKVQNLLLGQPVFDLEKGTYKLTTSEKGYVLTSKGQALISKLFLFDNAGFKLQKQQLKHVDASDNVTISYASYQEKEEGFFPKKIKVVANHGENATKINIKYRTLELNKPVKFPFKIPSGYQEIEI